MYLANIKQQVWSEILYCYNFNWTKFGQNRFKINLRLVGWSNTSYHVNLMLKHQQEGHGCGFLKAMVFILVRFKAMKHEIFDRCCYYIQWVSQVVGWFRWFMAKQTYDVIIIVMLCILHKYGSPLLMCQTMQLSLTMI